MSRPDTPRGPTQEAGRPFVRRDLLFLGTARQIAAMAVAGDRRPRLATVTAPTLVIHGADDRLIPPACGLDTVRSIPNAIHGPIVGMGHDLPPELDRTVIDMIREVAGRASRHSRG